PIVRERRDIERRPAIDDQLGDGLARRGRVHDPVPGESGRAEESLDARDRADDRMLVRRVLVEAGPTRLDVGPLEDREAVERTLDERRQEIPVHGDIEAGTIGRIGHPYEHAARLPVEIEGRRAIDGEVELAVKSGSWIGVM